MTRRELILAHLQDHPGETSGEIGLALGLRGGTRATIRPLLVDMRNKGQLVSGERRAPLRGRYVNTWSIAPPGTKPIEVKLAERELQRRREHDREAKRRARAKSFIVPSAAPVPDLRGAACAGADPGLFFSEAEADIEAAQALCRSCPVRLRCGQWAEANGEESGIWAGEDRSARRLQVAS